MALAEDPSAPPALKFSGAIIPSSSVTSANFNPPANSLIMVISCSDSKNTVGLTGIDVTDSIGNTFSRPLRITGTNNGYGSVHLQYLYAAQTSYSVTVTLNNISLDGNDSHGYIFEFYVITGASDTQLGASGGSSTGGAFLKNVTLTPTCLGSYIYGGAIDYTTATLLTPQSNCTVSDSQTYTTTKSWQVYRSTSPTSSLTSQTFGFTDVVPGNVIAFEVVPLVGMNVSWTAS